MKEIWKVKEEFNKYDESTVKASMKSFENNLTEVVEELTTIY